ncbi:MAG: hypothetical protein HC814_00805 [Rhodobacteraceae bacterium]|nr:hypothetical protein [Paracoccaceae bacterium]
MIRQNHSIPIMTCSHSIRIAALLATIALLLDAAGSSFAAAAQPAYQTETWPAGRTLTWASPGTSGDIGDATLWLEGGKPATAPPDRNTDVVLPAAKAIYTVKGGRNNQVRHVTIEDNARITGAHRNELEIGATAR